ncbi:crotonase/enoyl-CoA hydratase family protein [Rhizobium sp. C4]|uniref:crotonase/enoyl-CoA hydratase family protein n=1 Tax=Rhizobium sp. C4 TaxID=1349800 RepID=UPI001E29E3E6|nr:crotonase/enoyl-CoA hydratase family protein [Rhizobium sp. C4]MCD2173931.1 crotonase/enoyl-CoA hydratase family protein [Rhizobium sp. C4]
MADSKQNIRVSVEGNLASLTFCRPEKRNAINDRTLAELRAFFTAPPQGVRCVIMSGEGGHYSAGLDLSEAVERNSVDVFRHSRSWHEVMDLMQFGGLPIVSAMQGAVMGGGLEIAAATHVRIAEPSVKFQLPEGKRGIYVGGGATARISRIVGPDRMTEMMLTGRIYSGEEGQKIGLAHYLVGEGEALAKAKELAENIATNSTLINQMVIQGIARINDMSRADGLYVESLTAAMTQTGPDAREGLKAFLEKRKPNFS